MEKEGTGNELKYFRRQNLRYQLALENYVDDTGDEIPILIETWKKQGELRKNKEIWSIDKQLLESKKIQENFQKIVEIIGKEKFIFYDDGDINYIWKKRVKKEGK